MSNIEDIDYLLQHMDSIIYNKHQNTLLKDLIYKIKHTSGKNVPKKVIKPNHISRKYKHNNNKTVKRNNNKQIDITINDTTPEILVNFSNEIKNNPDKKVKELKSYSPLINNELVKQNNRKKIDIFANCKSLEINKIPKIWNGKMCIAFNQNVAKIILLNNLSSTKLIPYEELISPKQYQSNCWFNVMYMILFISDKGRKFYRFFRQLMILGTKLNGDKIPNSLWKSFSLLNLAIEATLTGYYNLETFDTNKIIINIYNSIPKNKTIIKENIYKVDEPGNPTDYYSTIMHYLNDNSLYYLDINCAWYKQHKKNRFEFKGKIPETIIFKIDSDEYVKKPQIIKIVKNNVEHIYSIDAAAIIDTTNRHFSCLITYDKNEYGFDGASFKRINPFKWKKLLNKNKHFTFKGSNFNDDINDPVVWNFRNGYQELFYYKIAPVTSGDLYKSIQDAGTTISSTNTITTLLKNIDPIELIKPR